MAIKDKKRKIGILTYHAADNYGSVLQAYALNHFLSENFFENCEIINYRSELQQKMYALYFENKSIKDIFKNLYIFFALKSKRLNKIHDFLAFRKKYLKMYPQNPTSSVADLELNRYDIIVCGSDQIWNVRVKDYNDIYMLKNIPTHCFKLSYAASMGGIDLKLTAEETREIHKNLKNYAGISVRENVARKMLSECSLDNVETNIDPTFLLTADQWKNIMSPRIIEEEYIFFYSVDYNEESVKIAEWYGDKLNLPVIYVNTSWRSYFIKEGRMRCANTSKIEDFLSLVYYAKAVLSGSFHGTAFSLIFNKPFYRIQRNRNQKAVIDDRVRSLFSVLDVQDREISAENYKDKVDDLFDMEYQTVNKNIQSAREKAREYFADTLAKEVENEI